MKVLIGLAATTALLGACASAPTPAPAPAPESATRNAKTSDFTVTQGGANYVLSPFNPNTLVNQNGVFLVKWSSGGAAISGYASRTAPEFGVAAGLDNGTYFAGVSGTPSSSIQISGTANYVGMYGFVVNGTDIEGPLALTANFGAGTLLDTSAGIDVNGTISGTSIGGSVTIGGQTGILAGGFYVDATSAIPEIVAGAVLGPDMAGIIKAH